MAIVSGKQISKSFGKKQKRNNSGKNPTFTKGVLGKDAYNKIGNFQEATGGGTPLPKGHKLKDHPEAHRVTQPRDEKGRFTYNSMNKKGRKFKYHAKKKVVVNGKEKWVEKTKEEMSIPPVLLNIKFEGAIKAKDRIIYNGKLYVAGVDISKEDFIDMYREYKNVDGKKSDRGFGEIAGRELGRKQGRQMSKAEKQVTRTTKQGLIEGYVKDKTKTNRKAYRHSYYKKTGK